jgi:hypothetical protein
MSEEQWTRYQLLLAHAPDQQEAHCVSCWYEQHDAPFPAADSSSLCVRHVQALRLRWTCSLQQREVHA